ncbi:MAG: TrmB family transcriptional regulator sugar-binding domain-containing protein, partial [Candidatus Izemoplasmatales bacterium]|nr:TrmB family transcriptional regulator sugar-binding domain-containing protein [Candidatus Izemoplasmatales bacterium]
SKNVVSVLDGDIKRYVAVPYEYVLQQYEILQKDRISKLKELFQNYVSESTQKHYVLNIETHQELIDKIQLGIRNAKKEIALSIWNQEISLLKDDLMDAAARGVRIDIFSFSKIPFVVGYQHCYEVPDIDRIFFNRRAIVVVDRVTLFSGEWTKSMSSVCVMTQNVTLVNLALDQMILDGMLFYALKNKGGFVPGMSAAQYQECVYRYYKEINLQEEMSKFEQK